VVTLMTEIGERATPVLRGVINSMLEDLESGRLLEELK